MKFLYLSVAILGILGYNLFLIERDRKMFEAYDKECSTIQNSSPLCIYSK